MHAFMGYSLRHNLMDQNTQGVKSVETMKNLGPRGAWTKKTLECRRSGCSGPNTLSGRLVKFDHTIFRHGQIISHYAFLLFIPYPPLLDRTWSFKFDDGQISKHGGSPNRKVLQRLIKTAADPHC